MYLLKPYYYKKKKNLSLYGQSDDPFYSAP